MGQAGFANTFQTQDSAISLILSHRHGSPIRMSAGGGDAAKELAQGPGSVQLGQGGDRHRVANELMLVLSLEN